MDAVLEVTVAGQHRGDRDIALVDSLGDRRVERARVADAGGAAVADQLEAEGVEVLLQDRKSTRLNPVTNAHLVCLLMLEKKKKKNENKHTKHIKEKMTI